MEIYKIIQVPLTIILSSYTNKVIHKESNKAFKFITIILLHFAYTSVDKVLKVKKKKFFKKQTKR